jgi:predicted TIM-barrel fold metal-dependent hydrolase
MSKERAVAMRAERGRHAIKDQIDHPVIDADAHWLEPLPVFFDYVATAGGPGAVDRFRRAFRGEAFANNVAAANDWYDFTEAERLTTRVLRPGFWSFPSETLDFATASLPRLLRERLEELGIDYAVVYPTSSIPAMCEARQDIRRLWCRAYNLMVADAFGPHREAMTPAAMIPTHTPEEAVEELAFVTGELGLKSIVIYGHVLRVLPQDRDKISTSKARWNSWLDFLALDSIYDYDPFWRACVEHRVPVTAHGLSVGWPNMQSRSSYMFNHIGLFGTANYSFCKALVLGGVPRRFPELRVGFLESGVAWACQLYADTLAHYQLRNTAAMEKHLRPSNLDLDRLRQLWASYADPAWADKIDELIRSPWAGASASTGDPIPISILTGRDAGTDEFARMGGPHELQSMFADNFFFGCEAEDRTTAFAFDNHLGFDLRPTLGSDIGHWDVAVMAEVMTEAHELVTEGVLSADQFKALVYTNPARLYLDQNPEFFNGTVLESRLGSAAGVV